MMVSDLKKEVQYLKGVGPRRAKLFARLGVETVEDLLYFFPRDYQDRRRITPLGRLKEGETYTVRGRVLGTALIPTRKGKNIFRLVLGDDSGRLAASWFNQPYLKDNFSRDDDVILYGKIQRYQTLQMINPEYEILAGDESPPAAAGRFIPVYPLTAGLNQKTVRRIINRALTESLGRITDMLPDGFKEKWQVIGIRQAISAIHYPESKEELVEARKRLILDEFFLLQLAWG